MPTRRLVVSFALATAAACSGDVTGPTGALRFRVEFLSPTEIVPGERIVARVEVRNPTAISVAFRECAPVIILVRDGAPNLPLGGFACLYGRRDSEIPAGGSLVDTVSWSGRDLQFTDAGDSLIDLRSGRYRIRPALLVGARVEAGGEWLDVRIRPWTRVRLVNTAGADGPVDLVIGGRLVARGVAAGAVSPAVVVAAGAQSAEVLRSGSPTALAAATVELAEDSPRVFAIRRAGGAHELWEIPDGAPAAAAGQTYVRVIHLAESAAAVELRALPPGGAAPVVVSPFTYGAISSYLVGATGAWRVVVVNSAQDTLLATAPLPLAGGSTRDVFLVDSPTGRVWATLVER
jgi:hypothetical protein